MDEKGIFRLTVLFKVADIGKNTERGSLQEAGLICQAKSYRLGTMWKKYP